MQLQFLQKCYRVDYLLGLIILVMIVWVEKGFWQRMASYVF